jgi:putative colanic acid biosynthesis UDP-glucose lipid carrier transferase
MRFETPARWAPAEPPRKQGSHLRSLGNAEYDAHSNGLAAKAQAINRSAGKRALDICVASGLIIFLLPALIAIAIAIKATSPGPVLFRQQRYGAGKRAFWICKFRTMGIMETHGSFVQASRGDARVTFIGGWLRRSSMDELPQLFNVLGGTMSLVGPRPHAVPMDDYYSKVLPNHSLRHLVRPGITGLAQVKGFRGPTDELADMAARVDNDIAYIRDWSLKTDIVILCRTPMALFGRNAF